MAKKDNQIEDNDVHFTVEEAVESTEEQPAESPAEGTKEHLTAKLKNQISQTRESDEAPSASLRLRDVLGGDFLWTLVRRQIWLIILVVIIVTAYVAVRYQCQQDAIDTAQLEKDLIDAKFESLSSSSNLTRMSRQSNITMLLQQNDSVTTLHHANQPPYIIDVPEEEN
jgi:hypothetical protein